MLVKVAQRQLLQLVEQILAQLVAALLRQLGHQVGLEIGGGRHKNIDQAHEQDTLAQFGEHIAAGLDRVGQAVDDGPHGIGTGDAAQAAQNDADEGGDQHKRPLGQVAEGAQSGGLQILGLAEAAAHAAGAPGGLFKFLLVFRHYSDTPSC